jgi:2-amino-4-hydroxy-6-hydroxymethyldihydropteridine diphosphokinase
MTKRPLPVPITGQVRSLVFIGMGANLGNLTHTLALALAKLATLPETRLQAVSGVYRSAPLDADGPDYLNAVACLETALAPLDLLDHLQTLEHAHGRARPFFNAPRTLDLDLLLYGEQQLQTERLTVPHPRLQQRAFVLLPLLELSPNLAAPGLGSLQRFLPAVADQAIARLDAALSTA